MVSYLLLNARLIKYADIAAIPATSPPIAAVINNNMSQCPPNGKTCATRVASIWLLGTLLNSAITVHTINMAAKADQNACAEVFAINNADRNEIMATIHQGSTKLTTRLDMSMMKNNIGLIA